MIKIFFLFIIISLHSLPCQSEQIEPTSLVYHSVNVITGEYCEAENDTHSNGPCPLQLRRTFDSQINGNKWVFNHPNIFTQDSNQIPEIQLQNQRILYTYDSQKRLILAQSRSEYDGKIYQWMRFSYPQTNTCEIETHAGEHLLYRFNEAGLLEEAFVQQGLSCKYQYQDDPRNSNRKLISQREESGQKESKKQTLFIEYFDEPKDPHVGKVRLQKSLVETDNTPIITHRFVYYPDYTEVYDALNHKTVYRHANQHLTAIEQYLQDSSGCDQLYRTEHFIWIETPNQDDFQLSARAYSDANGHIKQCYTYEYDDHGLLIKETLYGNLTGKSDISILLQKDGTVVDKEIEHYSTHFTYQKNAPFLLTEQTSDNGNHTLNFYQTDSQRLSLKIIQAENDVKIRHSYFYDSKGFLIKTALDDGNSTDPTCLNGITERHLTSYALRTEQPGLGLPETIEEHYQKDGVERLLKRISNTYSARGDLLHQDIFDSENRLIHSTQSSSDDNPDKNTTYRYDAMGYRIASIDTNGNETQYTYDAIGRLVETTFPAVLDGNDNIIHPIERREYDLFHRVTAIIDANGYETRTCYNARGKPTEVIHQDGTRESFLYNLDGSLSEATAKNGSRAVYQSDYLGRVIKTEYFDASGSLYGFTSATYNAFHQLSATDEKGFTKFFEYDEKGHQLPINKKEKKEPTRDQDKNKEPSSTHTTNTTCYNDRGQQVPQTIVTDAYGNNTTLTMDALNRIESIVKSDSLGQTLLKQEIRYDAVGNKVRESNAIFSGGNYLRSYVNCWQYGPEKRLVSITEAAGSSHKSRTQYDYDQYGQLRQLIKPDGVAVLYSYDTQGRVSTFSATDNSFSYAYTYDSNNLLIETSDELNGAVTRCSYDENKRLIHETLGNGLAISYTYDQLGQRTQLYLPDSSSIQYEYNTEKTNQLKAIHRINSSLQRQYTHEYSAYDATGKLIRAEMIGNLGEINYTYNQKQQLSQISSPYWSQSIHNQQDCIKEVLVQDSAGDTTSQFDYDSQKQLTQETGAFSNNYSYDSLSNRLSKNDSTYSVNDCNQLIHDGDTDYIYNANGCLIEKSRQMSRQTYKYDALNRLIHVTITEDDNSSRTIKYTYDGFNRRLSKTVVANSNDEHGTETVIKYLYDGSNEIGSVTADDDIAELRILGLGKGADIGAAIAIEIHHVPYAPIHDHRGNVSCLIHVEQRTPIELYRYSAFGEMQIFSASSTSRATSEVQNPWLFSSKRYDEETGLIFFGKRLYDPAAGRWITPDPAGFVDGPNLYAFVHNNPLSSQDLYGLFSWNDFWDGFVSTMSGIYNAVTDTVNYMQQHYSYANYIKPDMDSALENLFGKSFLAMSGYYYDYADTGVYGSGEFDDKVRITYINGILNMRSDCINTVSTISDMHGGVNIHYVIYPTDGWTHDVLKGGLAKFGHISSHAKLLAEVWKQMIQEMGGTEGGGVIIHYAHSIGGTNTTIARDLLTPEEQKMIRVFSIGSATMIPNTGFQSVINYMSCRDGIVIADPIGFFDALFNPDTNVVFIGSWQGIPLIDHMLSMETYSRALEMLGKQFVETYGRKF